jgi:hypothetical protein
MAPPQELTVDDFLADGFDLLQQLAGFLQLEPEELADRLPSSNAELAALHPGAFDPHTVESFSAAASAPMPWQPRPCPRWRRCGSWISIPATGPS